MSESVHSANNSYINQSPRVCHTNSQKRRINAIGSAMKSIFTSFAPSFRNDYTASVISQGDSPSFKRESPVRRREMEMQKEKTYNLLNKCFV